MDKENYLKPPGQQSFYKAMAFMLAMTGLNEDYWAFYKMPNSILFHLQRRILHFLACIGHVSQIIYLVKNFGHHDFTTLAMIYVVVPIGFVVMLKTTIARTSGYKKAMREFMDQIHMHSYYLQRPDIKEILLNAEIRIRWSMYTLTALIIVNCSAFLVVPVLHNLQNNESIYNITSRLEILIHYWVPFDYEFNFFNWIIMQVVTIYTAAMAVLIMVIFDIVNLSFVHHLTGHVKVLKVILKRDFKETMTHNETKCKLIEVTRYYAFIRRIFNNVEAAFGLNVLGIYMHNLFGGGLMMYMFMAAGNNTEIYLSYGLMIPIYMGGLIIMSLVLENVRIESDDIPEHVYNLRWEKMSIPNQKLVLTLLTQVQPVLEFKAAFGVRTGIQPAMNIIKTAFSYYVLIKSRMN